MTSRKFIQITASLFVSFLLLCYNPAQSQTNIYSVTKTSWSSPDFEEFSPVYFNDNLVFCSNRKNVSLLTYQDAKNSLLSMFSIEINDSAKDNRISLFSTALTTQLNDGPATFNLNADTIYFSQNLGLSKKLIDQTDSSNRIGIFSSSKINGKWQTAQSFPYNSSSFSNKTPALSPDGKRLYFSSNRPGGFGGFDIYYCSFINGEWTAPVNLGSTINTGFDECFPYADDTDKLYFSSAGHNSLGGLDIFYTQEINNKWAKPIHLEKDLNSIYDDFGIISQNNLITGYLSSNRDGGDDIFSFSKNLIKFDSCPEQKENKFCFQFYDERTFRNDTIHPIYEWDFGNNVKLKGEKVSYCFAKAGEYSVVLRVINPDTGDTINNPEPYSFELNDIEQPYITCDSSGQVGQTLLFDAGKTNLPGFSINKYYWDFGEGFAYSGKTMNYHFRHPGDYKIQLGLIGKNSQAQDSAKVCTYKFIHIR